MQSIAEIYLIFFRLFTINPIEMESPQRNAEERGLGMDSGATGTEAVLPFIF